MELEKNWKLSLTLAPKYEIDSRPNKISKSKNQTKNY